VNLHLHLEGGTLNNRLSLVFLHTLVLLIGSGFVLVEIIYYFGLSYIIHFTFFILFITVLYFVIQPIWLTTFTKYRKNIIYITTSIAFVTALMWNVKYIQLYNEQPVYHLYFFPVLFATVFLNQKVGYLVTIFSTLANIFIGFSFTGIDLPVFAEGILMLTTNGLTVFLMGKILTQRDEVTSKQNFLINHVDSLIIGINSEGVIDLCNKKMCKLLGVEQKEIIGEHFWKLVQKEIHGDFTKLFFYLNDEIVYTDEELAVTINGEEYVFSVHTHHVEDDGFIGGKSMLLHDITERKMLENELKDLATRDSLTGLYNRRYFDNKLNEEIQRSKRYGHHLSLMILDIDYFKKVNDQYGHAAGDEVLKLFAVVLKESVRNIDVCARIGGEEFVVLFPETNGEDALKIAERLHQIINTTEVDIGTTKLQVTVSIGLVTQSEIYSYLLDKADKALYQAKENGRNQIQVWNEGRKFSSRAL
jgi:diguanylate cyclase (GGDEF)-like protein/PAS domain S-box-containing protein